MNAVQKLEFTERLLRRDADDLVAYASRMTSRRRGRALSIISDVFAWIDTPNAQLKAVVFVQSALSAVSDRRLSTSVSRSLATQLSRVAYDARNADVRQSALDSLALLHRKSTCLTETIDDNVRRAFKLALRDDSADVREFAKEGLAKGGVLSLRVVGRSQKKPTARKPALKSAVLVKALIRWPRDLALKPFDGLRTSVARYRARQRTQAAKSRHHAD